MTCSEFAARKTVELRNYLAKIRVGTSTIEDALGGCSLFLFEVPLLTPTVVSMLVIDGEFGWTNDRRVQFIYAFFFVVFFVKWMFVFSRTLPKRPSPFLRVVRLIGAAAIAGLFSFFAVWYFQVWNVLASSGEEVYVTGQVVHMEAGSARWLGKAHYVSVGYGGRSVMLTVSPEEYARLRVGDRYGRSMRIGGLGYYYKWGTSWWK